MNAISIRGLSKRFGRRVAVDGLDLEIEKGEFFALLGSNGAGKTTTIRMLCGLCRPSGGDAFILSKSVTREAGAVKALINLSPQETAVAPNLTVFENLELMSRIYGEKKAGARKRARAMTEEFGLAERAGERAKRLSGGMQRRLSLAMALTSRPEVLFLDEPTLGLDVRARRELWRALEALKGNMTVVLTTHYLEEAEALADRIAIMDSGRLVALGSAGELKRQTGKASLEEVFLTLTKGGEEV